jgi:hypothetical protein
MTWVRIEDTFPEHPKIAGITDGAFRAHVCALCYCSRNLTDGEVTPAGAKWLGIRRGYIRELTIAGLWEKKGDGWLVHDFLKYNPSRAETLAQREKKAAAGKAGGLANARASARSKTVAGASRLLEPPSRPVPNPSPGNDSLRSSLRRDDGVEIEQDDDPGFGERYGQLLTSFGGHVNQRMSEEFAQIATDQTLPEIQAAILECNRANVRPYPSRVRDRLPARPVQDPFAPGGELYVPSVEERQERARRKA